jgi:hypothetical protein
MGIINMEHPVVRDGTAARDETAARGATAAREGTGTRGEADLHRKAVPREDRQGLPEAAVPREMKRASPRAGTAEAETTGEGEGGKTGQNGGKIVILHLLKL